MSAVLPHFLKQTTCMSLYCAPPSGFTVSTRRTPPPDGTARIARVISGAFRRAAGDAVLVGFAAVAAVPVGAQQVVDTTVRLKLGAPAFQPGRGPLVLVDEGHHEYHTLSRRRIENATGKQVTVPGTLSILARLLQPDGFVFRSSAQPISAQTLDGAHILIIDNALAAADSTDWSIPNYPAFSAAEIDAIDRWVRDGGSLLLIADHIPFPAAASELAARFGLIFQDSEAIEVGSPDRVITFRRSDGSLGGGFLIDGRDAAERVDSVTTFGGQAFRAVVPGVRPVLTFGEGTRVLFPVKAPIPVDSVYPGIPWASAVGLYQGVVLEHGAGRVAAFGEAAMFTAQVSGPDRTPMGFNHPRAGGNPQFILNLFRWLAGMGS